MICLMISLGLSILLPGGLRPELSSAEVLFDVSGEIMLFTRGISSHPSLVPYPGPGGPGGAAAPWRGGMTPGGGMTPDKVAAAAPGGGWV